MNLKIKKKWLEALRSGEYKQGTYRLCSLIAGVREYCCLGVLTDLYVKEHPEEKWIELDEDNVIMFGLHNKFDARPETAVLPLQVMQWAGLPDSNPTMTLTTDGESYEPDLSGLNDEDNKTFDEIADIIEANE